MGNEWCLRYVYANTHRTGNLRQIRRSSTKAQGKYEMVHDEGARLCIRVLNLHRPLLRLGVLRGPRDGGRRPHI